MTEPIKAETLDIAVWRSRASLLQSGDQGTPDCVPKPSDLVQGWRRGEGTRGGTFNILGTSSSSSAEALNSRAAALQQACFPLHCFSPSKGLDLASRGGIGSQGDPECGGRRELRPTQRAGNF